MSLKWTFVVAAAFVSPAWACFPTPGAQPTHEISIVDLSFDRTDPTVVLKSGKFAIHVAAEDLLAMFSLPYMDVAAPNDLADALRSKLPLTEDLTVLEFQKAAYTDAAKQRMEFRDFVIQSNTKLNHAFAKLLEQGTAYVVEAGSGQALTNVKLDKFKEICHGGRVFTDAEGREVLRILDSIS